MDVTTLRESLDGRTLTPPVRRALGSDTANVTDWDAQPIGYAAVDLAAKSVYRVTGHARVGIRVVPWNLVLKIIRQPAGSSYAQVKLERQRDPFAFLWAAEPLAYESGLLADLPGIAAPRCFGVVEGAPDLVWIWLEEVREDVGRAWPLERYGSAARHFGRFNGAYLTGRPIPTDWWVGQGRCGPRSTLAPPWQLGAEAIERDDAWDHPVVRRVYSAPVRERLRRLWAEDDRFYAALGPLPRTLCHFDAFRPNLFARRTASGEDQTVAVDWSFVGTGAVGEELAAMVAPTLLWFEVDADRARDLGETVFEGYLAGLRDAGWTGDAGLARLGYVIAVARYAVPASAVSLLADEANWQRSRHIWGRSLDELAQQWPATTYFLLEMADEARERMNDL